VFDSDGPDLTAIIVTPDGYETIARAIENLKRQTARDRLEVLIVAPSADQPEIEQALRGRFRWYSIEGVGSMKSSAASRAEGVRRAKAPVVALVEDHSFPEPDWASALIEAHRGPWAVVGPVIANGNPDSMTSWANLLVEYGQWLEPGLGGAAEHLPGHNSSYKREVLLGYGARLAAMLEAESILHWDLRSKGYQLYQEPAARTRHWNFSSPTSWVPLRFNAGRLFAASRAKNEAWSPLRRLLYTVSAPAIPIVRLQRIVKELQRPGRPAHLLPRLLPALVSALIVDGFGEMAGYALGSGNAETTLYEMEFHRDRHLTQRDRSAYLPASQ
jgi:hypothetical protein